MNNEVLGKIEEYNSELFKYPTSAFSNNTNNMGTATLLNLFTPPINSCCTSVSFPKEKTADLIVEQAVDTKMVHDDPAFAEQYMRNELALKLAKQLIEEDLIQIQSRDDITTMNTIFRAKIKIVQE